MKELDEKARVYRADVFKYLKSEKRKFDIIFADPPYDLPNFETVAQAVLDKDLLSDEGIFILEHPKNFNFNKKEIDKVINVIEGAIDIATK